MTVERIVNLNAGALHHHELQRKHEARTCYIDDRIEARFVVNGGISPA